MDDQSLVQVNITIKSGERLIQFNTKTFSTSSSARFIQTEVRDVDAGTWVALFQLKPKQSLIDNYSQIRYDIFIPRQNGDVIMENPDGQITVLQGGSYTFVAQQTHSNPQLIDLKSNVWTILLNYLIEVDSI